jgi:hypothetical protein
MAVDCSRLTACPTWERSRSDERHSTAGSEAEKESMALVPRRWCNPFDDRNEIGVPRASNFALDELDEVVAEFSRQEINREQMSELDTSDELHMAALTR